MSTIPRNGSPRSPIEQNEHGIINVNSDYGGYGDDQSEDNEMEPTVF